MAQATSQDERRQELLQTIIDLGTQAFHPDAHGAKQVEAQQMFEDFISKTKTLNLIPALNLLIRPGAVDSWLRKVLLDALAKVPLRSDGVRSTLEFVFAVHPSSTIKLSEAATPQKKGANITQEGLAMASQLLSVPPSSVNPEVWYSSIAPQLLTFLDEEEGPELTKTAAYVVGFGILGRKSSGSPGSPGWRFFAEPLIKSIMPPVDAVTDNIMPSRNEIIDLSEPQVLVSSSDLATAIRRLRSLLVSHPNPGLCRRLLSPLLLPLWALASWPNANDPRILEKYRSQAKDLLRAYLKLTPSAAVLMRLVRDIGYSGGTIRSDPEWTYCEAPDKGILVVSTQGHWSSEKSTDSRLFLANVDRKVSAFLDLVESVYSDGELSTIFLALFKDSIISHLGSQRKDILVKQEDPGDPFSELTKLKFFQGMMERFPEKISSQPTDLLQLVSQVLANSSETSEEVETTAMALSLLGIILGAPSLQNNAVEVDVLHSILTSLDKISKSKSDDVLARSQNLAILLRQIIASQRDPQHASGLSERQAEDRKTYNLAISYITQSDSLPPVKYEGLNLISSLVSSRSPVLDIPATLVLLSSALGDDEDYINLLVIKVFTQLVDKHPRSVTTELTERFVDVKEMASVDTRLRFGETLLQVIERLGETFTGEVAQRVGEALLATAGRRGYRPKTEAKQAREERLHQMKRKEAEEAWEGEPPDLSEDLPEEERVRNEIISSIVEGWESKKGAEDVRVRASALSIFANAMETNIGGLGVTLVSAAVDLSLDILQLERDMEKGILRRSAILLVLSLARALESANQRKQQLGFGLAAQDDVLRVLRYIAETDNDGLVRQHSQDVIESLENWSMTTLLPESSTAAPVLTKLAGLSVDPERAASVRTYSRPKIEEVE